MPINEINPMMVLYFSTQTTLRELNQYVRTVARQLYKEACRADLEVAGPVYFIYYGADGKPDTEFILEIALPITPVAGYAGEFQTKQLPFFRCISTIHGGDWSKISETYGKLIGELLADGHTMNGVSRELYLHLDFQALENNITEIQVGIQ